MSHFILAQGATGARYIRGPISEIENKALKYALTAIGGTSMLSESGETSRFKQVPQTRAAPLILASLERSVPDNPEILICLDFGTAMSKAAATKERDENLLELPLGSSAGDANTIYGLRSSLFVSRSGRIYFGHEAIAKSMNESDSERRRFDSLKQQLSQGELTDLSEKFLDVAINPTNVPLSHADAILLYLAYLTDMATSELASRYGLSRYVRRRFARPCWESNRAAWAMDEMRMMLAKAQIIADTFHGMHPIRHPCRLR